MPPLVGNFILLTGGALMSLPCVRGGAVLPRGTGVVPDTNYLFLLCKLHTFTIPQALSRQLPLHKGAFSYFLRTLRECPLLLARATIGRPLHRQRLKIP